MMKWPAASFFATCLALTGCGGSGAPTPTNASIGGTVSGFGAGQTLLLTNNSAETIRVTSDGNFTFGKRIREGASYNVSILGLPSGANCNVRNGSGTIVHDTESISNVSINCSGGGAIGFFYFYVGVTVSGLLSGNTVTFLNGGIDKLTANDNGLFVFPQRYAFEEFFAGAAGGYTVAVQNNPNGQTCSLSNASGAWTPRLIDNFVNVIVTCK